MILGGIHAITNKFISGWAGDTRSNEPVTVELLLDGVVINTTAAVQEVGAPDLNDGRCGWRFGMRDIWQLIRSGQALTVRVADGPPLRTWRGKQRIPIGGPEPADGSDTLLDLISAGLVVDKFGRAIRPVDARQAWQRRVTDGFALLRRELEDTFGYTPFLTYGMLLGYARQRAPITADHDCDVTYLSDRGEPDKVRVEFEQIVEHLVAIDDNRTVYPYKIVWHGRFSITPSWICPDGMRMTFGYVSDDAHVGRDDIFPLQEVQMGLMRLLVPRNAERVAEFIYGPGWRYPDSGWVWRTKWKTRPEQLAARLNPATVDRLNETASPPT